MINPNQQPGNDGGFSGCAGADDDLIEQ